MSGSAQADHHDAAPTPTPAPPASAAGPTAEPSGTASPWARRVPGTLLGCLTAPLGLAYLLGACTLLAPLLLWPGARPRARGVLAAGARRLAALERVRRSVFFGDTFPRHHAADDRRVLRYLAHRTYAGLLCGIVVALLAVGCVLAGVLIAGVLRGSLGPGELLTQALLGGVLLFLDIQGLNAVASLDARLARACFGPSDRELLQLRIEELATSRAAVVQAVDTERRRIERDLHDGVQQRLVALAMLLGRARRCGEPTAATHDDLLAQAHAEATGLLTQLREVAWRVYPSALDSLGLRDTLDEVAQRCVLPVHIAYDVPAQLPQAVRTAAYFVVSEAVTNATKHSGASAVHVHLRLHDGTLTVRVEDDGAGGADPHGSGLTGLRSRVTALDGRLDLTSPAAGPTALTAHIPCPAHP